MKRFEVGLGTALWWSCCSFVLGVSVVLLALVSHERGRQCEAAGSCWLVPADATCTTDADCYGHGGYELEDEPTAAPAVGLVARS